SLSRDQFDQFLHSTVMAVLNNASDDFFWSMLLACNKGLMLGKLLGLTRSQVRASVKELSGITGNELLAKVRNQIRENLISRLDTNLLHITPNNYTGQEFDVTDQHNDSVV